MGLIIEGNITHNYGWHMTFFSILPIVIIVTILIQYFVIIESKLPITSSGNNSLTPLPTTNVGIQKRISVQSNMMSNFDIKGTFILAVMIIHSYLLLH